MIISKINNQLMNLHQDHYIRSSAERRNTFPRIVTKKVLLSGGQNKCLVGLSGHGNSPLLTLRLFHSVRTRSVKTGNMDTNQNLTRKVGQTWILRLPSKRPRRSFPPKKYCLVTVFTKEKTDETE